MSRTRTASTVEERARTTYNHLVRAAGSVATRMQRRIMSPEHLTESQVGVLEALLEKGPLTHRELAKELAKTSGNLTLVVDNLEKRSLARRQRSREDRRSVTVHLTPQGRRLIEEVLPRMVEGLTEEMSPLTREEQEELGRLCSKLRREEA